MPLPASPAFLAAAHKFAAGWVGDSLWATLRSRRQRNAAEGAYSDAAGRTIGECELRRYPPPVCQEIARLLQDEDDALTLAKSLRRGAATQIPNELTVTHPECEELLAFFMEGLRDLLMERLPADLQPATLIQLNRLADIGSYSDEK